MPASHRLQEGGSETFDLPIIEEIKSVARPASAELRPLRALRSKSAENNHRFVVMSCGIAAISSNPGKQRIPKSRRRFHRNLAGQIHQPIDAQLPAFAISSLGNTVGIKQEQIIWSQADGGLGIARTGNQT